ncbi:MAG: efflux RND transporter periplasmic adaptor subunit [Verrucomicrobiota bacterium]|nr:efflux RND transporter periplasmic adaptor subunit [Verrucomicrobiota bacterium]
MQTAITKSPTTQSHSGSSFAPAAPAKKRRSKGAIFLVILGLVVIFVLIFGTKALQIVAMISEGKAMVEPPTTVTSAKVQKADWAPSLTSIGSIAPVQGATISAELPGMVAEIGFESGRPVKKGDLLVKLDASTEQAQLRSAQADFELMKAEFDRAQDLSKRNVISKAEFDAAASKHAQARAAVENMQSVIDKKEIRAPFDGIAGIREVNPGQMVPAGQRLVTLQALDKVFVDFSLPQQDLGKVKTGLPVKVTTDAIAGREFTGTLTAINSAVDPATRSVSLQATIDNADHALRAGMFARVEVQLPETKPTLFIPVTAVAYAPYGNSVYVIESKKDEKTGKTGPVSRQQFVRTGEARGDFVAVTEGLKEGQEVVSTGVFKMRNGMHVAVDNNLAPKAQLNPTPPNS